jgi:tripartite-type tricarboxylate transporter receptor subunit TctC
VETWFGLVAPAATSAAIVQKLHDAWARGAKTAEAQAAFDNISGTLRVNTPQEFGAFIKAENARWGALIRKLDIKAN